MATKPELRRAVANSYIKASDYNYNFEQLNNYIENGVADNAINNYEADREYSKGQWVLANTSEGKGLYESQVDGNKGNSLLDTTYWEKISLGGGLEIGDIGFTQMAIDESKGKRRVLNGQLIIQEQYVQFTNIVKNSVALNPDLACTESEWQTAVTMSEAGICYKFVIDDEAGTIRLPKYPSYFIGGVNGIAPVAGNGLALGIDDGSGTYKTIGSCIAHNISYTMTSTVGYGLPVGTPTPYSSWYSYYTAIGVTSDPTKSGIEAQIEQEKIVGAYFIQVATGAETEDNIINEHELINPYSFGDSKYSQIELNNLSWLLSLGQWNSKADYTDYYDWILTNANEGKELFKLSTDEYDDYCWVVNTAEETFRLPLLDGSEDLPSARYDDLTLEASGTIYTAPANGWYRIWKGAGADYKYLHFYNQTTQEVVGDTASGASQTFRINIYANRGDNVELSYDISGQTDRFRFYYAQGNGNLYFYVGETVQNANLINAGRIEEKLANCITRNDCKAYITETYVNGASWYRVYSDGWCEQGGHVSMVNSKMVTVTFLKPFVNAKYTPMVTGTWSDSATGQNEGAQNILPTSMSITASYANIKVYWQACGYIN